MQVYLYSKSGHNFGLENVRRVSAVYNMLKESDPILCTADYRAATFAKSELGVQKGVGIDVIGNLPNVMERGDILIYDDSGEASDTMQLHMKDFSTHLYKVGVDIPFDVVDNTFFEQNKNINTIEKAIFFADDDYANWFYDLSLNSKKQNLPLLLGHYFFLGNEDKLVNYFSYIIEEEEYEDTMKRTKYLLTSSVNSCMESLASGNCPVYFRRYDKENPDNFSLLKKYNIPTIDEDTLDGIINKFENIIENYPSIKKIERFDISSIKKEIFDTLEKFKLIQPSLDYKF
ncbi:MAG: hypothetical protein DRG78_19770 [Epsilonproteobacteria bacterium]|nr:MAG: hypothetical protein DRG78_19770 [Campylobacterota bacterium]